MRLLEYYVPLMREFLIAGQEQPTCSEVATKIYETNRDTVLRKFKKYISGAEATGIVVVSPDQAGYSMKT